MGQTNIWYYVLAVIIIIVVLFLIVFSGVCSNWYSCLTKPSYFNLTFLVIFGLVSLGLLVWSGYSADSAFKSNGLETDIYETFYLGSLILFTLGVFSFLILRTISISILIYILALSLAIGSCIYACQQSLIAGWTEIPYIIFLATLIGFTYQIYNANSPALESYL